MGDNETELLSASSKIDNSIRMQGSKQNLGHKRRRSVTPVMRPGPIAIAPKTNVPRNLQNVELTIKSETTGFITLVPRTSQILSENEQNNKSIGKVEQFEIFESLSGVQNAKRIKIGADDGPMQYIILRNQNLDNCNAIVIADNEEKLLNQQRSDHHEYPTLKNNIPNIGTLQHCNVVDRSNLANCSTSAISQKPNFTHQEHVPILPNSGKSNFNLQKNISMESPPLSIPPNRNIINNHCKSMSKNVTTKNMLEKSDSLNTVSREPFGNLDSLKSRSQKPVVIMQQQLSPPIRTRLDKTKRVSISSSNKLLPLDIHHRVNNIQPKILSEHASPPKSNESYYDPKTMNQNPIRINNDEQETDFLLKKEFPVISSSQVDSVLKAIDMQELNKGITCNEITNHSKREVVDNDATDIGHSLPCVQGAAKLCKNESTLVANIDTDPLVKIQTNRSTKRFQSERHSDNYNKDVKKLVDTLQCYKCKECSFMSLNEKHISEHIEKHHINVLESKEKPVLKCPGCSNTFHYEASLFSHIVHDHQVHESEAQIMAQQLSCKQSLTVDDTSQKPIPQIQITAAQNNVTFTTEIPDPLVGNDQGRTQIHSTLSLPKITLVTSLQTSHQPSGENAMAENGALQYVQNFNNMPVMVGSSLEAVDILQTPFLNDVKTFPPKSDLQQNHEAEVVENKNVDIGSEKLNLFELKNAGERNFEFVNFQNVTPNEGEGYLQEDEPMNRATSDSEMEFVELTVRQSHPENTGSEMKTIRIKKKGRPKGSKSHSAKPQAVSLNQGYKCGIEDCSVRMLLQENITYHQKCHVVTAASRNISFQCPECIEFKSNYWNNLAGHLWRSHIIDMELHSCDLCSYKSSSLSHLTNQHRRIHGEDRPFQCDECGKGFKTTKQLRNHRALHNAKAKKPLQCDECKRNFTNMRLLKLHKDSVHKEAKPFTCSSCPYSAATRSALKLHLRRHTGEKPFFCDHCSYSTGDHNSMRRHKLRHLGLKPYSCPHCNYACIQSSTYKVHLKNKHPGLDHNLMFSCQYCSYKSIKKDNLLTHMAKHEQVSSKKSIEDLGSPIIVE